MKEFIVPLEKELDWGYSIPYMLTGQLNEHPRAAMKARMKKIQNIESFTETTCRIILFIIKKVSLF